MLDPNIRTLLGVQIKESDDHDRLFSDPIGDLLAEWPPIELVELMLQFEH